MYAKADLTSSSRPHLSHVTILLDAMLDIVAVSLYFGQLLFQISQNVNIDFICMIHTF